MKYLDHFRFAAAYGAYARRWWDVHRRIEDDRRKVQSEGFRLAYEVPLRDARCRFVAKPKAVTV